MSSSSRRVTLNDVARQSGVSYQTVSRVINNHPYVADDTRERVLEVIKDLGYYPNKAAKSLASQHSQTIAIISYGMPYYGPSQMLINIENAAKEAGYDLIFSLVSHPTLAAFRNALDNLAGWHVDGIVAITPVMGCSSDELQHMTGDTPLVQIDTCIGQNSPSVVIDQGYGSQLITRHLLELGHTQIAEISGPLNWHGARDRHMAWIQTLQDAGLEPGPSLEGDWTSAGAYQATLDLLDSGASFSALVAGNDQMALGAIRALRQRGRRIPHDVAITGFDNIPESAFFDPPLTTIWQDFNMVGQKSVEMLIERIKDPQEAFEQRVLYPRLLIRESTVPSGEA